MTALEMRKELQEHMAGGDCHQCREWSFGSTPEPCPEGKRILNLSDGNIDITGMDEPLEEVAEGIASLAAEVVDTVSEKRVGLEEQKWEFRYEKMKKRIHQLEEMNKIKSKKIKELTQQFRDMEQEEEDEEENPILAACQTFLDETKKIRISLENLADYHMPDTP